MNDKNLFLLNSYDYVLPEERIAQCPASERQNSRLLFWKEKQENTRITRLKTLFSCFLTTPSSLPTIPK